MSTFRISCWNSCSWIWSGQQKESNTNENKTNRALPNRTEILDRSAYPLFSVIVLCYKNRRYLNRMLESIFTQDYPNIELIVSDDGSADFSASEVRSYIEKNGVKILRSFSY